MRITIEIDKEAFDGLNNAVFLLKEAHDAYCIFGINTISFIHKFEEANKDLDYEERAAKLDNRFKALYKLYTDIEEEIKNEIL